MPQDDADASAMGRRWRARRSICETGRRRRKRVRARERESKNEGEDKEGGCRTPRIGNGDGEKEGPGWKTKGRLVETIHEEPSGGRQRRRTLDVARARLLYPHAILQSSILPFPRPSSSCVCMHHHHRQGRRVCVMDLRRTAHGRESAQRGQFTLKL